MPNKRGTTIEPDDIETARNWGPERWRQAEPQERRGQPGSRGMNHSVQKREDHGPKAWTGVNPLPPLLPEMPRLMPGDQGG